MFRGARSTRSGRHPLLLAQSLGRVARRRRLLLGPCLAVCVAEQLRGTLVALAKIIPERRVGIYRRWWYHGWPAGSLEFAAAALAGTTNQIVKELPFTSDPAGSGCNALALVNTEALAPLPDQVEFGDSVFVYSPPASELVPTSTNQGIVVYVTDPGGDISNTILLEEGESTSIRLDLVGDWHFRLALFSENLCEAGTADSVVVQEQTIEVVGLP